MKIQKCRGMRDLAPQQMAVFRRLEGIFRESCLGWGYREVRTPTIEYLHLFTSAGTLTPAMLRRVYSFLDWDGWSGERVVLRPDGTIPVARLYIDSVEDKSLARLFYVNNIFIFEETGRKPRERWQCGAELIGVGSAVADAELVALSLEVLRKLGVGRVEVKLSHAGFMQALLARLGLSPQEQAKVFDQILEGNGEALARVRAGNPHLESALLPLLNLKGQSSGFLKNSRSLLARDMPEIVPCLDSFIQTAELLEVLGCDYRIDIASGAGFEYYTGMIFQLFAGDEKIGGGGRYDALIPAMGGGDIPASGFALYLDRLMELAAPGKLAAAEPRPVLVRAAGAEAVGEAFNAAAGLRRAGYVAAVDLGGPEPEGLRWVLEVRNGKPAFTLNDRVKGSRAEAGAMGAVLKLMEA